MAASAWLSLTWRDNTQGRTGAHVLWQKDGKNDNTNVQMFLIPDKEYSLMLVKHEDADLFCFISPSSISCHSLKSYQRSEIFWYSIIMCSDLIYTRPFGNERNIRFASESIFPLFPVSKLATRWCIWERVEWNFNHYVVFKSKLKAVELDSVHSGIHPSHLNIFNIPWCTWGFCRNVSLSTCFSGSHWSTKMTMT